MNPFEDYFKEADLNQDGKNFGDEAALIFEGFGSPEEMLAPNNIGLGPALSLMLQDGHKFWKMATEESKRREEVEKKILETYQNVLFQMNNIETEFNQREKQHHQEIKEIQKRENDKKEKLNWDIVGLKWALQDKEKRVQESQNQNERNEQLKQQLEQRISFLEESSDMLRQERDNAIRRVQELQNQNERNEELKQELEQSKSFLEENCNRLRQERDNAIKMVQELQNQNERNFVYSDMPFSSQFSSSDLKQATKNFSDSLKIGEGGFGCVYKGSLRETTVAIKKLNSNSIQGLSQFQQEVAILTKFRHPNLVNLVGSCSEISALVYEFMPNGSLEDRLVCANGTPSLTWQARTCIISEICLALVFLHSNKPNLVILGDLKPENILLDSNFVSKLGDFGLSRVIKQPDIGTTAVHRTSNLAGTFAYMDPQFFSTGELTPKSDVYSFGIIVLRLLTGKPPLDIASNVRKAMQSGGLQSTVDESAGKWPFELAEKLAKIGLKCANVLRKDRCNMVEVWSWIEPLVKIASKSSGISSVGSTCNDEHVPSHFICPILQEIMNDPHIAADGFTYEAEAIKKWLNTGHNTSPMTNLVLRHHDLIPNHALRSAIRDWLERRN